MILDELCVHNPDLADGRYSDMETFSGDEDEISDDFYYYIVVNKDETNCTIFSNQHDAESKLKDGESLLKLTGYEYSVLVYGDGIYHQTIIEQQENLIGDCSIDFTGESDWAFYYD